MAQEKRKPEKVFRIGFVFGSVFARDIDADDGKWTIRNVSLQKQYKDGDETKYTSSFSLAELPQAIRVLQLAQEHIEAAEANVTG